MSASLRATYGGSPRSNGLRKTVALLAIGLLAVLVGCGGSDNDGASGSSTSDGSGGGEVQNVRLGTVGGLFLFTLPNYAADDKGYYADNGVKVDTVTFESGSDTLKAIAAGSLDVAIITGFDAASGIANGIPMKVVAGLSGQNTTVLLARDGSGLDSIEDLAGKKIGLSRFGSITEWYTRTFAKAADIPIDDIKMIVVGIPGATPALLNGNVDAFWPGPDQVYPLQQKGEPVHVVTTVKDVAPSDQFAVVAASNKFIEENPDGVKDFLKGYFQGVRAIAEDKKYGVELTVSQLKQDPDVANKSWEAYAATLTPDGKVDANGLKAYADALPDLELAKVAPTVDEMFTDQFLPIDSTLNSSQ